MAATQIKKIHFRRENLKGICGKLSAGVESITDDRNLFLNLDDEKRCGRCMYLFDFKLTTSGQQHSDLEKPEESFSKEPTLKEIAIVESESPNEESASDDASEESPNEQPTIVESESPNEQPAIVESESEQPVENFAIEFDVGEGDADKELENSNESQETNDQKPNGINLTEIPVPLSNEEKERLEWEALVADEEAREKEKNALEEQQRIEKQQQEALEKLRQEEKERLENERKAEQERFESEKQAEKDRIAQRTAEIVEETRQEKERRKRERLETKNNLEKISKEIENQQRLAAQQKLEKERKDAEQKQEQERLAALEKLEENNPDNKVDFGIYSQDGINIVILRIGRNKKELLNKFIQCCDKLEFEQKYCNTEIDRKLGAIYIMHENPHDLAKATLTINNLVNMTNLEKRSLNAVDLLAMQIFLVTTSSHGDEINFIRQ